MNINNYLKKTKKVILHIGCMNAIIDVKLVCRSNVILDRGLFSFLYNRKELNDLNIFKLLYYTIILVLNIKDLFLYIQIYLIY